MDENKPTSSFSLSLAVISSSSGLVAGGISVSPSPLPTATAIVVGVFKPGDPHAPTNDERRDLIENFGKCSTVAALLDHRDKSLE